MNEESSRQETAYRIIKDQIITGKLLPGALIEEKRIAEDLNVSRTPVREAILELARERMVVIMPRRGTMVSYISVEDVRQLYEMRKVLEPAVARIAAEAADRVKLSDFKKKFKKLAREEEAPGEDCAWDSLFHCFLAETTGNVYMIREVEEMLDQSSRIRYLSNAETGVRSAEACREHLAIIEAMEKKDGQKAEEAMRHHLVNSEAGYEKIYSNRKYFSL